MTLKKLALSSVVVATLFSGCLSINMADTGMFNDLGDIKAHLAKGDDIDFQDEDGYTALIYSSFLGYPENIKYLLAHGAKLDIENNVNDNAFMNLFLLDNTKDKEIFELFMAKGVDVNQKNGDGKTALSYALSNGLDKHTGMLLDKGAKIDLYDNDGNSVLSNLCLCFKFEKSKKLVDVLVEKGIDLNIKDADGDTLATDDICKINEKLFTYLKSKGLK